MAASLMAVVCSACAQPPSPPDRVQPPRTEPQEAPAPPPKQHQERTTVAGRYATRLLLDDPAHPAFGPLEPPPPVTPTPALVAPGIGAGAFLRDRRAGPPVSVMFLLTVEPDGSISAVDAVGALLVERPVVDALASLLRGSRLAPHTGSEPVRIALEVKLPAAGGASSSP